MIYKTKATLKKLNDRDDDDIVLTAPPMVPFHAKSLQLNGSTIWLRKVGRELGAGLIIQLESHSA